MESPLRPPVEPDFRLIETLGFHPDQGFLRRDKHLNRMARTAKDLALPFYRNAALAVLAGVASDTSLRCRLTMDVDGGFELTTAALARNPEIWRLGISQTRLNSGDIWLQHKTTRRAVYDSARASMPDGIDEELFLNEREELCEGTITNLFVEMPNGRRLTPPVSCGLLPGILREQLLEEGWAEAVLTMNDLNSAKAIYVGNSLRGLIPAKLVAL